MKPQILKSVKAKDNQKKYTIEYECIKCHKIFKLITSLYDEEVQEVLEQIEEEELCGFCYRQRENSAILQPLIEKRLKDYGIEIPQNNA